MWPILTYCTFKVCSSANVACLFLMLLHTLFLGVGWIAVFCSLAWHHTEIQTKYLVFLKVFRAKMIMKSLITNSIITLHLTDWCKYADIFDFIMSKSLLKLRFYTPHAFKWTRVLFLQLVCSDPRLSSEWPWWPMNSCSAGSTSTSEDSKSHSLLLSFQHA